MLLSQNSHKQFISNETMRRFIALYHEWEGDHSPTRREIPIYAKDLKQATDKWVAMQRFNEDLVSIMLTPSKSDYWNSIRSRHD